MKKFSKFIKIFLVTVAIIAVCVIIPFAIEAILFNETIFPFSMKIEFDREAWFSFIGSYLGALGTIALGLLAFWQNKRYKELSDEKDEEVKELQKHIKDLLLSNNELAQGNQDIQENIREIIEKNTIYVESTNALQQEIKKLAISDSELQKNIIELLEVNKNISAALLKIQNEIYYPRITILYDPIVSESGEGLRLFREEEEVLYVVIPPPLVSDIKSYIRDYCGFISFSLVNDGEKDIVTFALEELILRGKGNNIRYQSNTVDVKPHQQIRCVIAFEKEHFQESLSMLNDNRIDIYFSLNNTIGESYIYSADLSVIELDGDINVLLNNPDTKMVESLDEWRKDHSKHALGSD